MLALVNGGTFDSATGGTFQSAADGTFHSDIPGTFESDMGGTFKVMQSIYENMYIGHLHGLYLRKINFGITLFLIQNLLRPLWMRKRILKN